VLLILNFLMKNQFMKKIFSLCSVIFLLSCNNENAKTETNHGGHDMPNTNNDSVFIQPAIPENARVFFVNLKDGDVVNSTFKVQMGLENMALDSAGAIKQASGHHHILIDVADSVAYGLPVPKDDNHLHFGNAQSETELTLKPGKHRISLQFADGVHRSYGNKLNTTITITVK
jgi:hypothetical protein